ncbi:uncharacterized protein LOC127497396 isoform X2 [Ctenopharyngodon idella]|uniref:uncharacterized protein LOC127497396 isoform X2 n=1 Tax=Ctenopharyngodon idella TaxID=7959 RepID=UPI00222EC575|nr:uncharacterized protein LOC127497396 isoform X2 [Ctenopharyngodon idella]
MKNTLKLAFLLMIFVVNLYAFSQGIKTDFVLVNTPPYTFLGNGSSCERAEWRKSFPTDATIATYQNKICQIEKGFHEEYICKENHLLLNSPKYTDSGPYEFFCNGVKKALKLDVLYAVKVYMAEMHNITLDCYAANVNDVTWLHKDEIVLHYKKDGTIIPGKGYERRVSLEKNCLKTGNLSLTITEVRKTDAGLYLCLTDDETTKGYPHTYLLHVNEKRSSPGNQTDSNSNEAQTLSFYKTLAIVFGIFSCILILVVVILLYKLYCLTSKPSNGQSTPATASYHVQKSDDGTIDNDNTTSPKNESQLMVNHPVQESDTTGNKSSTTKPF